MDVPAIDPLEFSSITVDTGNTGSVNIHLELLQGTVTGLKDIKIENLKANFGDEIRFSTTLIVPQANIKGSYRMKGNILLFDLNGEGQVSFNASKYQFVTLFIFKIINTFYFTLGDIRTDSVWIGTTYLKKNKEHISLDKILFNDVQIKNIRVRFANLFGPNSEGLTNTANNAINDNVETLRPELEPILKETLVHIIRAYFNRVYKLFPMNQLYPSN